MRGNSLTFDFQRSAIGSNGETVTDFETSVRQVDLSRVVNAPLGGLLQALDLRARPGAASRGASTSTTWTFTGRPST